MVWSQLDTAKPTALQLSAPLATTTKPCFYRLYVTDSPKLLPNGSIPSYAASSGPTLPTNTSAYRKYSLAGRYSGIRPAIGYDSLPDQNLMHDVAAILPLSALGVEVTPNGALTPSSTVCGLYLWHPDSRYFNVGSLADTQLTRYAAHRGPLPSPRYPQLIIQKPSRP